MNQENERKLYIAFEKAFVSTFNLKVGDRVKIVKTATTYEQGWNNHWTKEMSKQIGKYLTISSISSGSQIGRGIYLSDGLAYPYFVLEKDELKLPDPIFLSTASTYKAEFKEDGSIKVGCQTISAETLKKIYETSQKLLNPKPAKKVVKKKPVSKVVKKPTTKK